MRGIIAIVIACGCTETTHSVLPPYVRDLRPAPGGLQMVQCQIVVTTTHEHQLWANRTTREISNGQCWQQVVSTEPPSGAP